MLNIDPVVQVNVSVGANSVISGVFDVGVILTATKGTGTALTPTTRYASYKGLGEISTGEAGVKPAFASTTDVYKAAVKYFGVSPAPANVIVVLYDDYSDAEAYDSGSTYEVGDRCTNNSKIWVCKVAITEAEAWNADHWEEIENPETPTTALMDAIEKGAEFYGVYYSPATGATSAEIKTNTMAIMSALNSIDKGILFYGVTGTPAEIIGVDGIMKAMSTAGSKRVVGLACASEVDDAAGLMGLAMGYARTSDTRAFALCYKSIATASVDNYTQAQVTSIKEINGNVYVARTKARAGLENGAVASGLRFDDVLYVDKIVSDIQNGIYSMIADSPTKLPQNDGTTTLFLSEIGRILEGYYDIGVLATANWRGTLYGSMESGMTIEHGHMEFADSFDNQTTADRAAHKAMPITILLCLAGSVESIVINLDVQT